MLTLKCHCRKIHYMYLKLATSIEKMHANFYIHCSHIVVFTFQIFLCAVGSWWICSFCDALASKALTFFITDFPRFKVLSYRCRSDFIYSADREVAPTCCYPQWVRRLKECCYIFLALADEVSRLIANYLQMKKKKHVQKKCLKASFRFSNFRAVSWIRSHSLVFAVACCHNPPPHSSNTSLCFVRCSPYRSFFPAPALRRRTWLASDLLSACVCSPGERPFCCQLCPYRASQKGNLKTHVQSVHHMPFDNSQYPDARSSSLSQEERKPAAAKHVPNLQWRRRQTLLWLTGPQPRHRRLLKPKIRTYTLDWLVILEEWRFF